MLGMDIVSACTDAGFDVVSLDLPEFDITFHDDVREKIPPCDWVVNCAAYTDTDGAESHQKDAFAVNSTGVRHVAKMCFSRKEGFLHFSTDYVFDGRRSTPYTEQDQPAPMSVYGLSKLAGEKAIREEGGHYIIVRTQSLFGVNGRNFVKSIIGKLEGSDPIHVVTDQVSSPTYTRHLAQATLKLLGVHERGPVHVAASGECSWYEFAQAIADRVKPGAKIEPTTSQDVNRPAPRPQYSVLRSIHYADWTGHTMPSWQQGLDEYLKEEGYPQ